MYTAGCVPQATIQWRQATQDALGYGSGPAHAVYKAISFSVCPVSDVPRRHPMTPGNIRCMGYGSSPPLTGRSAATNTGSNPQT